MNYQFTITNDGAAAVNDLAIADDLSGVLDDATYNEDASASSGEVAFNAATQSGLYGMATWRQAEMLVIP